MGKQARLQEEYEFDETLLTQFGIRLEAAGMRIGYKSFPRQGPWPCPALGKIFENYSQLRSVFPHSTGTQTAAMGEDRSDRRSWYWAWDHLHQSRPGVRGAAGRLHVLVAETVLYKDNEPTAWIFTAKDGAVMRRHTKRYRTEIVVEGIVRHSLENAVVAGARNRHAAVVRRGNDGSVDIKACLLSEEDIAGMAGEGGGLTSNLLALQACVHTRANSGARYRCEARRESGGLQLRYGVEKLCYLGAPTAADAPHPRSVAGAKLNVGPAFALKCTMNAFNVALSQATSAIVSHLEAVGKTKIVRLQADFIIDAANELPMLVAMPLVVTTPLPRPPVRDQAAALAPSAIDMAAANALLAAAQAQPTVGRMNSRGSSSRAGLGSAGGGGSSALSARASACVGASAAEVAPAAVAADETAAQMRDGGPNLISSVIGGLSRPTATASGFLGTLTRTQTTMQGVTGEVQQTAKSRTGTRTGSASSSELLSKNHRVQISAVKIDAVKTDVKRPSSGGGLRPTPWLRLHPPIPVAFPDQGRSGASKMRVCSGDFCAVGGGEVEEEEEPNPTRGKRPGSSAPLEGLRPAKSLDAIGGAAGRGPPKFVVAYRSILLARAEHAMPKLSGNEQRDATVRATLLEQGRPGYAHPSAPVTPHPTEFYKPVHVCHACYVVYCRLDAARAQTCMPADEPEFPRRPTHDLDGRRSQPALEGGVAAPAAEELVAMPWRPFFAPAARLAYAELERGFPLGSRETKRLVAELQRRPNTADPIAPPRATAMSTSPSAVVSLALQAAATAPVPARARSAAAGRSWLPAGDLYAGSGGGLLGGAPASSLAGLHQPFGYMAAAAAGYNCSPCGLHGSSSAPALRTAAPLIRQHQEQGVALTPAPPPPPPSAPPEDALGQGTRSARGGGGSLMARRADGAGPSLSDLAELPRFEAAHPTKDYEKIVMATTAFTPPAPAPPPMSAKEKEAALVQYLSFEMMPLTGGESGAGAGASSRIRSRAGRSGSKAVIGM